MGNSNGRFSDGFLLGAIAGGAVVFLLGTQKGNRVLKLIMEEGRASLTDLMDEFEEYKEEAREVMEAAVDDSEESEDESSESEEPPHTNGTGHSHSPKPKSSKRFFRKAK